MPEILERTVKITESFGRMTADTLPRQPGIPDWYNPDLHARVAHDTADPLTEAPRYIIDGLIPEAATGVLYGTSGSYKSFFTIALAGAVATGTEFMGNATRRMNVAVLSGEGVDDFMLRVDAAREHVFPDLAINPRPWDFTGPAPVPPEPGLTIFRECYNPLIPDQAIQLAYALKAHDIGLFIIDTLATCIGNPVPSNPLIAKFLKAIKAIVDDSGASCIVVHHESDRGGGGRAAGGFALRANVDFMLHQTYDPMAAATQVRTVKMKGGAAAGILAFTTRLVTVGSVEPDEKGRGNTSLIVEPRAAFDPDAVARELLMAALPATTDQLSTVLAPVWGLGDRQTEVRVRDLCRRLTAAGIIYRQSQKKPWKKSPRPRTHTASPASPAEHRETEGATT